MKFHFIFLFIFSIKTTFAVTAISVTDPITVVEHSKIPCTNGASTCADTGRRFDSTAPNFIDQDGQRAWFVVNSSYVTKLKGPFNDPFQTKIWTKNTYDLFGEAPPPADNSVIRDKKWLMNLFQADAGELLGFVHVEREDGFPTSNGQGRVGLAWSSDYGESFQYLGNIMIPHIDSMGINVAGIPYAIKDSWLYVYYFEKCYLPGQPTGGRHTGAAVMRANITNVINAARQGQNVSWNKYYNGSWTEPGINGKCTMVIDPIHGIIHGDAVYSNVTNKFYMLTHHSLSGAQNISQYPKSFVRLMSSSDAVNWDFERTIVEEGSDTVDWGFAYPFAVAVQPTLRDNNSVSDRFYVYVPRDAAAGPDPLDQGSLIRMEVDLNGRTPSMPRDFSSTQNLQNFDYYFGGTNGSGYMTWNAASSIWKGNENFLQISQITDKLVMHPGVYGDAALRWTPPENGSINISGQVQDINTSCGDGALFRVLNATSSGTTTLYSKALTNGSPVNFNFNGAAEKGSKLYFIVNSNLQQNHSCDSTGLKFDIQYTQDPL